MQIQISKSDATDCPIEHVLPIEYRAEMSGLTVVNGAIKLKSFFNWVEIVSEIS